MWSSVSTWVGLPPHKLSVALGQIHSFSTGPPGVFRSMWDWNVCAGYGPNTRARCGSRRTSWKMGEGSLWGWALAETPALAGFGTFCVSAGPDGARNTIRVRHCGHSGSHSLTRHVMVKTCQFGLWLQIQSQSSSEPAPTVLWSRLNLLPSLIPHASRADCVVCSNCGVMAGQKHKMHRPPQDNMKTSVNLSLISMDCSRKPKSLENTHVNRKPGQESNQHPWRCKTTAWPTEAPYCL